MWPSIQYYCPCTFVNVSNLLAPPPPTLASTSASFHPLHNLYFCEECDAVRCNRCVSIEVSGYYCPNCLFEVPSASVRAEKNRCARNCFSCPICRSTLSVVASDPPDEGDGRPSASLSNVGEAPYFLYCGHCRWDSAEVGITFEKPTGLAAQLQKFEDSAPETLEFERLKEHFEPFLPAASAALARDIPGVGKYNPLGRSRAGRDRTANKDEMPEYKSRVETAVFSQLGGGGDDADVELLRHMNTIGEVAKLEQRWGSSWTTPLRSSDLRPHRIPLHSKVSKRCPACRHILIKPEQKAQSVRYKIKLVAANYLPAITVGFPPTQGAKRVVGKVASSTADARGGTMHTGTNNFFQLALTNPLYDPIQVRLSPQRVADGRSYQVSLPTTSFSVAAFAEAWEYDDDDMFGVEDDELGIGAATGDTGRALKDKERRGRLKNVGVLERRANVTIVGGEVNIKPSFKGNIKAHHLGTAKAPEVKTFSFYTVVDLGPSVASKDED
ncbi:dynactin p62 family-domain-containing protein [Chiua virens]|nr:dynactin p62 family-domain-containing protein [Chiua virens]